MGQGFGPGKREGGKNLNPGKPGLLPEPQRWRIKYSADSIADYANQLQFFDIELGAVSKATNRIDLISDLDQATPTLRLTEKSEESRLYFTHSSTSPLKSFDQRFALRAGIGDIDDRIVVQLYSEDTRNNLRELEAEFVTNAGRTLLEVKRCFFKVRQTSDGFEYFVDRVEYRRMPDA